MKEGITSCSRLTGTAVGTCTLEFVIEAGIATGMVCPLGRCNKRGKGPGTGLRKEEKIIVARIVERILQISIVL